MGVYKGIKWCGLREHSGLLPLPLWALGVQGEPGGLERSSGFDVSLSRRPPGCWGMVMRGRLGRRFTDPSQAPLRESPQVLGVPDGEEGELRFRQGRKLQTRCLKGEWSWGYLEPFLNRRRRNYLGNNFSSGLKAERVFLTRTKNFELQGSQGRHPFPLPAPLQNL